VDWQLALESVDRQRARLDKRIHSFQHEYQLSAQAVREAAADGNHELLNVLTHNLKSTAAYIGAFHLSSQAQSLELALREERHDLIATLAAELADGLDLVIGGLAQMAEPAEPQRYRDGDAGLLIKRLEAYLRADDARAEDVLRELRALPAATRHVEQLTAIQLAVDEIEYQAALAPLSALARTLQNEREHKP
jgi:HPt (histidine-containing phosphotransfer) domain-containing protein